MRIVFEGPTGEFVAEIDVPRPADEIRVRVSPGAGAAAEAWFPEIDLVVASSRRPAAFFEPVVTVASASRSPWEQHRVRAALEEADTRPIAREP